MRYNKPLLFFTPSLKVGGGNRVMIEIANGIATQIKQSTIVYILPHNNAYQFYKPSNELRLRHPNSNKNTMLSKIYNLLHALMYIKKNKNRYSLIVSDPILAILCRIVVGNNMIRFIQANDYIIFDDRHVIKSKIVLWLYKALTKVSYRQDTRYIFNSKYCYDQFMATSQRVDYSYLLVHPGVDHDVFYHHPLYNIDQINIAIVCRTNPLKGFEDFVWAWNHLDNKTKLKINSIFVVSQENLTQHWSQDFTLVKPDNDKQIAQIFNSAQIFVSTSWWEGFGLPPLEAMACGCAVLMSDSGGGNEYAIADKNCLMYEPKNKQQLAIKLTQLINDEDLRKKLYYEAIQSAKQYTWHKTVKQFTQILERYN